MARKQPWSGSCRYLYKTLLGEEPSKHHGLLAIWSERGGDVVNTNNSSAR